MVLSFELVLHGRAFVILLILVFVIILFVSISLKLNAILALWNSHTWEVMYLIYIVRFLMEINDLSIRRCAFKASIQDQIWYDLVRRRLIIIRFKYLTNLEEGIEILSRDTPGQGEKRRKKVVLIHFEASLI